MGSNNAILHLENIRKSFGGLLVLTDIDLSVEQGQIVGLIGPNGAGKSTLFNITTTIYKPDAGDIFLKQQKITGYPPYKICRLGISRTFQLVKTFLSMTALENVLVGSIYGNQLGNKHARRRAEEALDFVGLSSRKNVITTHQWSNGKQMTVSPFNWTNYKIQLAPAWDQR